jgi:hypothetical protein
MSSAKIFGLVRDIVTIAGISFNKKNSLTAAERTWLQENTEAEEQKFNAGYYAFVGLVQADCKLKSEAEAYHLVKSYFRGDLADKAMADRIELLSMRNPLPNRANIRLDQLTYLIDSRIVKTEFPREAFLETFGLAYDGVWTLEHTKAAEEIIDTIEEFLEGEANKTNDEAGGKKTA